MSRYLEDLEPTAIVEGDYPCNCTWLGTVKAGDELYSAATVERLMQERDAYRSIAEGEPLDAYQAVCEQLAASQAREQQLREALEAMVLSARGMNCGLKIADDALALSQDDTALRQWGAKLLRGMAEMDCFNDYMRERINRKADELEAGK